MTITRQHDPQHELNRLSAAVYELAELLRVGISDPMAKLSNEHRMAIERAAFRHSEHLPVPAPDLSQRTAL